MVDKSSKNHEIRVLNTAFYNSRALFDELGYSGYSFISRVEGEGVPDGYFKKGTSNIWVEHTEAKPNYGRKGERLSGFDGFCEDVRKALSPEIEGCICCDIPSSVVEHYLSDANFKKVFLDIIRAMVVSETKHYEDSENSVYLKFCSKEKCRVDLTNYKGLRVTKNGFHNLEFCKIIPMSVFETILASKESKYKANTVIRDENWLFIEIPFGYSFRDEQLPTKTQYFDKVFMLEGMDYSAKLISMKK